MKTHTIITQLFLVTSLTAGLAGCDDQDLGSELPDDGLASELPDDGIASELPDDGIASELPDDDAGAPIDDDLEIATDDELERAGFASSTDPDDPMIPEAARQLMLDAPEDEPTVATFIPCPSTLKVVVQPQQANNWTFKDTSVETSQPVTNHYLEHGIWPTYVSYLYCLDTHNHRVYWTNGTTFSCSQGVSNGIHWFVCDL